MKCRILALLAIAGLAITHAETNDESLPVLTSKVATVAAFKNGLAFVVRSGETPLRDGWARLDELPPATLGSLWVSTTSKSGGITDVIAYREKVAADTEAITMSEMLAANIGRSVRVDYVVGSTLKTAEGKLLAVPADRKPDEDAMPPSPPAIYSSYRPPGADVARGEIVLLRTMNAENRTALLTLPKSAIVSLEISGDPGVRAKVEQEVARTKLRVGGKPTQAEITLACLEKGIVWSPSYRINIADEKQAELELEAVFANDMEDLENADVSFVVGYPNFAFAEIASPISLRQSVAAFVQALASGGSAQSRRFDNRIMSQAIMFNNGANFNEGGAPDAGYAIGQPLPGERGEDLYFYRKSGVTLKKGDRATYNVLKTIAPYEHIYQWEIPDSMNVDDRGYRLDARNQPENFVWHVLRLENKGQQPWTTAPAFALHGNLPVAQDTLNYTPPGGRSFLKLTAATDVRGEQTQTETARKQVTVSRNNYDEITVAGKLKVTSLKNQEIAVVIRKSVIGEVLESPDGKVTRVARNLTAVNPNCDIEWEFKLPAGQNRELNYQYKVLLAR